MKAAVLHELKHPLSIEEAAEPKPDADEVLIEVEGWGVCHSDLHVAHGDWPQIVPSPRCHSYSGTKLRVAL